MNDEKYLYLQDIADKKRTGRSAFAKKPSVRGGRGCHLPSDYLSKKELKKMNGEVKSYRLNDPMKWKEFKALPDDLKKIYIQQLRSKFDIADKHLCEVFGCSHFTVEKVIKQLGLSRGKGHRQSAMFSKVACERWLNGTPAGSVCEDHADASERDEMQELFDLLVEPEATPDILPAIESVEPQIIPSYGMITFNGAASEALHMVGQLLSDAPVEITVTWKRVDTNG